jgi:hypothetical protein
MYERAVTTATNLDVASSIINTLVRLRIARAIQINCFSPAEKFSPPSDTGESRLRKTFTLSEFIVVGSLASSSNGMRWTRRSTSYYGNSTVNSSAL